MHERSIIHLNVADFAVAVERIVDRRLNTRPVVISAPGIARAAVYDMSEEAYQAGVRKGMRLGQALRCCNDASVLAPHPSRYEQAMRALLKRVLPYSPLIESGDGDGHLFVDVTGTHRLFGPPVDVAWRMGKQIRRDLGLNPIWSVASNKLVAKVATRLVKPSGEYVIGAGEEESFLAPLPLYMVPGIERTDLIRSQEFNLTRVGQVAVLSMSHLEIIFGRRAGFLYDTARGIDSSPVTAVGRKAPVIRAHHEFGEDTNELPVLEKTLYALVERAGIQMRRRRVAAGRIRVTIDYTDGIRRVRRMPMTPPSADDRALFESAKRILLMAWDRRVRIRHLSLFFEGLVFPPAQLPLFPVDRRNRRKRDNLVKAVDDIRTRFGWQAIQTGQTFAGVSP
jgi:DNA polymerase-4